MSAQFRSGAPASNSLLRTGVATIAIGATSVVVNDTAITANSVIVCWGLGAAQGAGDATVFSADALVVATSFQVRSDQPVAGVDKQVGWAILRY